jgi:hypothetical protein
MVTQIARQIAKDEINAALRNLHPGGLVPFACTIVAPVADLAVPACHLDIPYAGFIQLVTFRSAEVGSATVDIWKRRPTQTFAQAVSIVGATFPTIVGATDAVNPPGVDWFDWVEADSTLYYYITSTDGGFLSLTVNLWLRALSGVVL